MKKKYLINICHKKTESINKIFLNIFEEIYKQYWVITINIILSDKEDDEIVDPKQTKAYLQMLHIAQENIPNYIKKLEGEIYINTFHEDLSIFPSLYKKELWQPYTTNYEIFTDKEKERNLMKEKCPDMIPWYQNYSAQWLKDIDHDFPYIIKPTEGSLSRGVALIENQFDLDIYIQNVEDLQKQLGNKWFLVEEYVQWPMYTISYFVDGQWKIKYDTFCSIQTGEIVGIPDFWLISRSITRESSASKQIMKAIEKVIKRTVIQCGIKNTFIYQEVKRNNAWAYKIIELNARIWWYRLEMHKDAIGRNLFDYVFADRHDTKKIENNVAVISILPTENGVILKKFNRKVFSEIRKLPSVKSIKRFKEFLEQKVWYTKNGYKRLGYISLHNPDTNQYKKDYAIIMAKYEDLLILE